MEPKKKKLTKQQNEIEKARIYAKISDVVGEVCQVTDCGWIECLELHRVYPGKRGGQYEIDNCVILCPNHHALITKEINTLSELIPVLKTVEEYRELLTEIGKL